MAFSCLAGSWVDTGDALVKCGLTTLEQNYSQAEECVPGLKLEYSDPPPAELTMQHPCPFNATVYPAWEVGLKIAAYSISILMAVLGNITVLLTIFLSSRLHISTNFYLAQMAVADLMVGVFNMGVHLGMSISADWPFSAIVCRLLPFFQILSLTASVLCLTAIAGDRFFVIVYPFKARVSTNATRVVVMTAIWAVAVLVAVPNFLIRHMIELVWADRHQKWCDERWPRHLTGEYDDESGTCLTDVPTRRLYYTAQVVVMYCVPIVAMVTAYSLIGYRLRRQTIFGDQPEKVLRSQLRTRKKVIRMLVIVFSLFVVCWTPQEMLVLYDVYYPQEAAQISEGVRFAAVFLAYFNSSINPILYAWLGENFRKGFWELVHCATCKRRMRLPVFGKGSSLKTSSTASTGASRTPSYEKKHAAPLTAPSCEKCLTGADTLKHSRQCSHSDVIIH